MADPPSRTDPFSDVISLVAGPIAAVIRSFDQLRKGSDELMKGLENFNATMGTLNETAARVNRLLNDFEEPVRAVLPQVTRTVKVAEELTQRLSGPIDRVAPGLNRLADTLNSPVLASMPTDLGAFMETMNDLARRMAPLGQLAESAGGLFGLRIPGFGRAQPAPPTAVVTVADVSPPSAPTASAPARKRAPAKKRAAAKRAPAKKGAATKRTPAKKRAAATR